MLTGLLLMTCLTCLLTDPKTDSLKEVQSKMGFALSRQSKIKTMLYITILWRAFLNRGFFLSDDSSLCQIDIKTNHHSISSTIYDSLL